MSDQILTGAWVTPNLHICWKPGPVVSGWAQPKSEKTGRKLPKAHYFHVERSLCRAWEDYFGPVLDEQPEHVCKTCLRKARNRGWAS